MGTANGCRPMVHALFFCSIVTCGPCMSRTLVSTRSDTLSVTTDYRAFPAAPTGCYGLKHHVTQRRHPPLRTVALPILRTLFIDAGGTPACALPGQGGFREGCRETVGKCRIAVGFWRIRCRTVEPGCRARRVVSGVDSPVRNRQIPTVTRKIALWRVVTG